MLGNLSKVTQLTSNEREPESQQCAYRASTFITSGLTINGLNNVLSISPNHTVISMRVMFLGIYQTDL